MSQWAAIESTSDSRDLAGDWPIDDEADLLEKPIFPKQLVEANRVIRQLFRDYRHSLIGDWR